jgi:hypothetical protein
MSKTLGRRLVIVFLVAFASVTLSIDFFHTEGRNPGPGRNECPACHFHSSSLSVSPAAGIVLPALVCRIRPATVEADRRIEVPVLSLSSRAPPQA